MAVIVHTKETDGIPTHRRVVLSPIIVQAYASVPYPFGPPSNCSFCLGIKLAISFENRMESLQLVLATWHAWPMIQTSTFMFVYPCSGGSKASLISWCLVISYMHACNIWLVRCFGKWQCHDPSGRCFTLDQNKVVANIRCVLDNLCHCMLTRRIVWFRSLLTWFL